MTLLLDYYDSNYTKWIGIIVAVAVTTVFLLHVYIVNRKRKRFLHAKILNRQKSRRAQLENLTRHLMSSTKPGSSIVTKEREHILNLPTSELVLSMQSGCLSTVEVLRAFQAKAVIATNKCNCIVQFIDEAEDWSKSLELSDAALKHDLPLFGLPISLKEDYAIANYDVTLGLAKHLEDYEVEDGVMVKALKRLGAVPFCRTNVPQTLLSFACSNPIYGSTTHPTHTDRGPGGSSGGEGALIGSGGSILGFGSDIAGSVRTPAHMCGIVSLKPTTPRLSMKGESRDLQPPPGLCASPGILGRDVDTVVLAAKALFAEGIVNQFDTNVPPLHWKDELFTSCTPLRIGYFSDESVLPATPGCRRALHEALQVLRNAGHEIVAFPNPVDIDSSKEFLKILLSDGGKLFREMLKDEIIDSSIILLYYALLIPEWVKIVGVPIAKCISSRLQYTFGATKSHELWSAIEERSKLAARTFQDWTSLNLDVCLTPAFPVPAVADSYPTKLILGFCITFVCNYLNLPAGIVPVTVETKQDQFDLNESYDTEWDLMLSYAKKAVQGAEGLPLGVQVIGLPWQEEKVLRVMKELESLIKLK